MLKTHQAITAHRDAILKDGRRDAGFTLIELLIVVLIIGVLAAIAIPVYLSTVNTAKDESAKSTVNQAITSITAYQIQNGKYPTGTSAADLVSETDFRAPNASEIDVRYTGSDTTFCVAAQAAGGGWYHADQDDGAPQEGGPTCS